MPKPLLATWPFYCLFLIQLLFQVDEAEPTREAFTQEEAEPAEEAPREAVRITHVASWIVFSVVFTTRMCGSIVKL